jgi:hypothetical protein
MIAEKQWPIILIGPYFQKRFHPKQIHTQMEFTVQVANASHIHYAEEICQLMEISAQQRGTGIAKRDPDYIRKKMKEGKSIIALQGEVFAGFCYIESWGHDKYVANSGLIVKHEFRKEGLAKKIKEGAFQLSRERFPNAKIFGITTSLPVMKINTELGYVPVTFSELTDDEAFWKGCQGCKNYDVLTRTNRKYCLCTGMLYDPAKEQSNIEKVDRTKAKLPFFERWMKLKGDMFSKITGKKKEEVMETALAK